MTLPENLWAIRRLLVPKLDGRHTQFQFRYVCCSHRNNPRKEKKTIRNVFLALSTKCRWNRQQFSSKTIECLFVIGEHVTQSNWTIALFLLLKCIYSLFAGAKKRLQNFSLLLTLQRAPESSAWSVLLLLWHCHRCCRHNWVKLRLKIVDTVII